MEHWLNHIDIDGYTIANEIHPAAKNVTFPQRKILHEDNFV